MGKYIDRTFRKQSAGKCLTTDFSGKKCIYFYTKFIIKFSDIKDVWCIIKIIVYIMFSIVNFKEPIDSTECFC